MARELREETGLSDATDARYWTPAAFAASDQSVKETHVDRFGTADLAWLLDEATTALERWGR